MTTPTPLSAPAQAAMNALETAAEYVRNADHAMREQDVALTDAAGQITVLQQQLAELSSASRARTVIGMATPVAQWNARLAEVGPVKARRLFGELDAPDRLVALTTSETQAGRLPVLSVKVPLNDWRGMGDGRYDGMLHALGRRLHDATSGGLRPFLAVHHEPQGDGSPTDYAHMQRRALSILGEYANLDVGVIVNGFWFSPKAQGLPDTEVAQWLPQDVLDLCETVACDTYHGGTTAAPGESAAPKVRGFSAWATRLGLDSLGLGEWNGLTAQAILDTGDAIAADPRFRFACVYNSEANNRDGVSWVLTGDRLTAFQAVRDRFAA